MPIQDKPKTAPRPHARSTIGALAGTLVGMGTCLPAIAGGPGFAGAQSPTLNVTPALEAEGYYDVVLSNTAGETVSDRVVLAVSQPCAVDFNGDQLLDLTDIVAFVTMFSAGCP